MSSDWHTLYLKPLVEKADRQTRRAGGKQSGDYFECDCCGSLHDILTNFENHLVWSCGRRFGCKVVRQIAPTQGHKGTWYAENVQTGLTYQGKILAVDGRHLEGLTEEELAEEEVRREELKERAVCNRNRANKPKSSEMSYRLYQEKEWSNSVGYWKDNRQGMVPMRHNLRLREDEVVPGPEQPEDVDIHERQFQTWFAQGLDDRLRRDDLSPDIFVDNMPVLRKLIAERNEEYEQYEQRHPGEPPCRRGRPRTRANRKSMSEPLDIRDEEHLTATVEINRHRALALRMDKIQELANARGEMMDLPPQDQRPFGMFWDSLDEVQGMLRLKLLLNTLLERDIIFPGFESVDEFMTIGFKLLKASDGDVEQAASMAKELHTKTNGEWSQAAWDQYRNAQLAREILADRAAQV
ncbi:hypothetical protein DV738_g1281, partial [Chaetothyriales sp. CBS 135597]